MDKVDETEIVKTQTEDQILGKTSSEENTTPATNKGGEKIMAKDPEGVFDYSACQTYVVQKNETLFDVAQKCGLALQQLRYFNHLNKATWKIREGQTLYLPVTPVYVPVGK